MPEFSPVVADGFVGRIEVLRGAPCGATWEAAVKTEGLPVEEAVTAIGLNAQLFCTADPAAWDPIGGRSPLHVAGELHSAALKRALKRVGKR